MSKREQEKAVEAAQKVATEAKRAEDKVEAVQALQIGQQEAAARQFRETIDRSLDETKENVRKSIDETKNQIPRYTNVIKNYQEQTLESTGKMVEEYVEAQKSLIESFFSSAAPHYENATRMFNYWYSPKVPIEIYTRSVSNIAENILTATKISNDILFGNIDTFGNAFERAQRHTEELSRINVNNAKTIADTARQTAAEFSANRQKEVYG
jgi:hypothetical protein